MITGYNTDVRHGEVVFHVQTEDKGAANPFIESLVYVGGQVLASKRASYAELLEEGREEKEIIALMDHQHRTMIAAIRHGKFDDKLAAAGRRAAGRGVVAVGAVSPLSAPDPLGAQGPHGSPASHGPGAGAQDIGARGPLAPATARPGLRSPAEVAPPGPERTLDQVILEYLTNEADQEQLVLLLEGEADLGLGRRAALALRASSSKSGLPVAGAQVSVRMISTVAEPRILAHGRTDEQGALPLAFDVPSLDRGTAALIITAVSGIGRAELKHLL